jgi:hypothetical protein
LRGTPVQTLCARELSPLKHELHAEWWRIIQWLEHDTLVYRVGQHTQRRDGDRVAGRYPRYLPDFDSPTCFVEDTPTATLVRQVLGAVAQFDKAMTVANLRLARDRIRKRDGKCEGRKSHAEERPEAVAIAKQLHKQGTGYRAIGTELAKAGHVNERGKPFHHKSRAGCLSLVAGVVDECRELAACEGMTADGVRLCDRDLVLGAFVTRSLWFRAWRSHREAAGRHHHHRWAVLVIRKPLGLSGTWLEPTIRCAVGDHCIDFDAPLGLVLLLV